MVLKLRLISLDRCYSRNEREWAVSFEKCGKARVALSMTSIGRRGSLAV
jgi:hypothetical protein